MNEIFYQKTPVGILQIEIKVGKLVEIKFIDANIKPTKPTTMVGKKVELQLNEYFEKKRKRFDLPIKLIGTEFQKKVWSELAKIPYGHTENYQSIAWRIGKEKAYRAVGNANNRNPIPIVIPCHRVVPKNGGLGGYAGGVSIKKKLLLLEKKL